MESISALSDDLLLKILSFLSTKSAVSTSILSKRWQFLWMWLPKLEYNDFNITGPLSSLLSYREFTDKNLPLHRAPAIESLLLRFCHGVLSQPEKIKLWVGIAVSRFVRELSISYFCSNPKLLSDVLSLPSSLYTCNSLMTLKLEDGTILVDVPPTVSLPSLKTLHLRFVTYLDEDSLRLLLSSCPVLEDLLIQRNNKKENVRALVVNVPSLQRLSLEIDGGRSSDGGYVIVSPCLKYLKIVDYRYKPSYLIEPMPKLEEADIDVWRNVEKIFESVTSVRRLSLHPWFSSAEEFAYPVGIVFSQLEHFKLRICSENWSKLLVWLLRVSPRLRVLNVYFDRYPTFEKYDPVICKNKQISAAECLLSSLETFEFTGFIGTQEDLDFLSFFFKHASCLKSTSIIDRATQLGSEET